MPQPCYLPKEQHRLPEGKRNKEAKQQQLSSGQDVPGIEKLE